MKIKLENIAPRNHHGIILPEGGENPNMYFCLRGINIVFGKDFYNPKTIEISNRKFEGSIKISVDRRKFSSKMGFFGDACAEHGPYIAEKLGKKNKREFSFYAKIEE